MSRHRYTLNVPWREDGIGDADYESAIELVLLPVIRQFAPQLLLVSAGFDAADGDVQVLKISGVVAHMIALARRRPNRQYGPMRCMMRGMRGVQGRMKLSPAGFGSMTAALLSLGAFEYQKSKTSVTENINDGS